MPEDIVGRQAAVAQLRVTSAEFLRDAFAQIRAPILVEPRVDQGFLPPPRAKQAGGVFRKRILRQLVHGRRRKRLLAGFGINTSQIVDDGSQRFQRQRLQSALRRCKTKERLLICQRQAVGQLLQLRFRPDLDPHLRMVPPEAIESLNG